MASGAELFSQPERLEVFELCAEVLGRWAVICEYDLQTPIFPDFRILALEKVFYLIIMLIVDPDLRF